MNRLLVEERTSRCGPVADWYFIETRRYRAVMRAQTQIVAVPQAYNGIVGLAKLAGTVDNGLENRPDIGWRGCDHAEDVAAAGLVGQRLREVAGLRLNLLEQADILDRDHG